MAIIFALSLIISFAKLPPALPTPWIATVAFSSVGIILVCSIACFRTNCPPRAVAVLRPSEPPFSMDLPVTTALAFSIGMFSILEYSLTIVSIILELVYTSGAGMSFCGPIIEDIFFMNARVRFSSSCSESSFGLQITPPFAPPNGRFNVAVFIVIHIDRALTSSRFTSG